MIESTPTAPTPPSELEPTENGTVTNEESPELEPKTFEAKKDD